MSPVSSVESWFFSSLGWKVPMPTRSFSLKTSRWTRMCFITRSKSPSYWPISSRKTKRQAGHSSLPGGMV